MSLFLLFLLPTAILGQWGMGQGQLGQMGQQQQLYGQYPPASMQPQFGGVGMAGQQQMQGYGIGLYSQQQQPQPQFFADSSRFSSPLIRPNMMGYGRFNLRSKHGKPVRFTANLSAEPQPNNQRGVTGYPMQQQGQMQYQPQPQVQLQNPYPYPMMQGVGTQMGMGAPHGFPMSQMGSRQFQSDAVTNYVQKPVSSLQPTRIIPPFMKNATPQQLDEFYAIVQNPVWSPSEKQQKIEEFVRGMDTNTQNTFASYSRATQGESEARRQKVHRLVDEMTPEAQVQFQKVSALMTNPSMNETDRLQKIQDVYSKIPDTIKKEFDEKLANL